MSNPQYNLSPVVLNVLLEAMAEGRLHAYNITGQVHANTPIHYGDVSALFNREEKGVYRVTLCKADNAIGQVVCATPIEAKATVLNYLATNVKNYKIQLA